jgi:hypothetical protein
MDFEIIDSVREAQIIVAFRILLHCRDTFALETGSRKAESPVYGGCCAQVAEEGSESAGKPVNAGRACPP